MAANTNYHKFYEIHDDYIAAEGIFLARGLFTTLQENQTPSEERHSQRG